MSDANRTRGAHVAGMLMGLVPDQVLAGIMNWRPVQQPQTADDRARQLQQAKTKRLMRQAKRMKRK